MSIVEQADTISLLGVPADCVTVEAELPEAPGVTKEFLQRIEETWGKPECPTDWIKLPSQRRSKWFHVSKAGMGLLDV